MTKFKAGDSVYAFFTLAGEGGYAQFVIAKENELAPKPKSLTYEEAAAVPAVGSTAWQALVDGADLTSGQTDSSMADPVGWGIVAVLIVVARADTTAPRLVPDARPRR